MQDFDEQIFIPHCLMTNSSDTVFHRTRSKLKDIRANFHQTFSDDQRLFAPLLFDNTISDFKSFTSNEIY